MPEERPRDVSLREKRERERKKEEEEAAEILFASKSLGILLD